MTDEDSCKKTLCDKSLGVNLVSHVANSFPDCMCENHSVSNDSVGPVCDNEFLIHLIMSPVDVDEITSELKPEVNREAATRGMSCFRMEAISNSECHRLGAQRELLKNNKHKYQGFVAIRTREVRGLLSASSKAYCVYDTALPDEKRHSDVMCALREKAKIKEYQIKLWGLMNNSYYSK